MQGNNKSKKSDRLVKYKSRYGLGRVQHERAPKISFATPQLNLTLEPDNTAYVARLQLLPYRGRRQNMACADCFTGDFHHSGVVTGAEAEISGIPLYEVIPHGSPTPRIAIVICTDIFGYKAPNARLYGDKLAVAACAAVFIPDILGGDAVPVDGFDRATFPEWRSRHGDSTTNPIVTALVIELRARGYEKVFAAGFCFGARAAVLTAQLPRDSQSRIDGFSVAHPSFVMPTDVGAVSVPGQFLLAEVDAAFPTDAVTATRALEGVELEFVGPYSGTTHGFTMRGAETDVNVAAARDDAILKTAAFFNRVAAR